MDKLSEIKTLMAADPRLPPTPEQVDWLITEVKRLRPKDRVYPCGCIACVCEDDERCHECGATGCGQPGRPTEHTPGAVPMSIPALRAEIERLRSDEGYPGIAHDYQQCKLEVERLTKRCEEARFLFDSLAHHTYQYIQRREWLEGKP